MPDGLQSFNVPSVRTQNSPTLYAGQITAPANYQAGAMPPQYTGAELPAPISYAPTQTTTTEPSVPPPGAQPPPFMAVLQGAEKNLGRPLTQDEFDQLTNDYKTNYAVPALNAHFKGKKANVDAEVASFDNQAQHLRAQRYGSAQDQAAKNTSTLDAFGLGALGGVQKGAAGIGVLAASLADVFGLAPNQVADYLRSQANVDQQSVAQNEIKQLQDMRSRLIAMYPQNAARIKTELDAKIAAISGAATTPNLITRANTNNATASKDHPIAAFAGNLVGQIAPFLVTRGAGTLATATGEAVGHTGANAAEQLNANQDLGQVQTQAAIDAPLQTLAAYLPARFGGKLLARTAKGATVGGGINAVQQTADVGVNPNNKFDTTSLGASTALGALIAAIPGAHIDAGLNLLKRRKGTEPAPDTAATQAGAPPAAETAAPAAPGDTARPAAQPIDTYKAMLDTAPQAGIEQPAFIKLQATALEKANAQAKKFKSEIQAANTPEKVVEGAMAIAERFTGNQWGKLNAEQRAQTVETLSAWIGKKSKVSPEALAAHIETLRNPTAPEGTIPPITEQPLPGEITGGQQVPGTVPQTVVPKPAVSAQANKAEDLANLKGMGKGIADSFYDGYWDSLTGGPKASSAFQQNEPSFAMVKKAVDEGKITSRDQLKALLLKAQEIANSKNKLKGKTKPVSEPKKPEPPSEESKSVADTVNETLADTSTPETTRNKLKGKVKEQTETQYNQSYLKALMNRDNAPADAAETKLRADPAFNSAADALRKGKITSPEDLGRFLKEQKGTATVGDELAGHETKQIGALLGNKSTKSAMVQARKAVRTNLVDPLVKLGEDASAVNKMTVAEATTHLQKLANTFTNTEAKVAPKKGLKKSNVEPVDNPDEPPPTKPRQTLKKTNIEPVEKPAQSKAVPKGKTQSPKDQAPASESGATPLEAQLRKRFGGTLPQKRLDALHDAISEAKMGDGNNLADEIVGLRANDGEISKADIKWIKSLAKEEPLEDIQNNASGESSASLEAQRRLADERSAGQTRAIIRRDGSVELMHGVDAVDTHARAGEVIVQRGIGKDEWTILSHGDDISKSIAEGKINRARSELDNTHASQRRPTLEESEALNDARSKSKKGTEEETPRIAPVHVKRRVKEIVDDVREGADVRETGRRLQKLHDDIEQANMERKLRDAVRPERRGVEYVRARLQKMVSDHSDMHVLGNDGHYEAGKFGLWLLEKNPNLANYLAIHIKSLGDKGPSGRFLPWDRTVVINSADTNPGTVVHEILHSAEQLMPDDIQIKLRGEYVGRLQNKLKQTIKNGNKTGQRYLELAIQDYAHPSAEARKEMSLLMRTRQKEIPYDEFYKYSNPSEYLAVEGTNILSRRYGADSWVGKLANWLQEYWQHAKSALGLDSNSQVVKAVNASLKSKGEFYNPKQVRTPRNAKDSGEALNDERAKQEGENPSDEELGYESADDADIDSNLQKEAPAVKTKVSDKKLEGVGKAQHFIEHYMSADYGLEKAMQGARRMGIKVTEKNDVENAAYARNGLRSEYNNKDMAEAYEPAENWVYANMDKFAKNMPEMLDKVNKFFHNTNWLERGYTSWYLESPLGFKGALDRAEIMDKVQSREITGTEARRQLVALAGKHSSFKPEEWMVHEGMPVDTLKEQLQKLATESGMDQKSMSELNSLMDLARDRQRDRLIAAGKFTKDDPYQDLYGWKWYVPLKGSAYGSDVNNFDLIPTKNIALGRLNAQIKAMEGRKSFAERPFSRLFVDMTRAGSAQAESHVKNTAYELITDIMDKDPKSGYSVHTFEGGFKEGYTNTATGEKVDKLKAPSNGIIVNDGDTHYVITTPKDSQLLRGLIKMNEVERPNAVESAISHPTNALARLYTTVHPGWQTFSGFVRDLTYIPVTDAATNFSNPIEAIPTWAKYSGNVLQAYKALPTLIPHLLASNPSALKALGLKTPRQMGEAAPDSWAGWTRRYEAAGGANFFTQGFDVPGMERIMQSRLKDVDGVLDATKWGWQKVLEYTGNYANFLEGIGRVAMFKTKVEMGMPETQAAVEVRKLLDYSKSGLKGRRINSWLAFFRVGMTGADAMRRAFTNKTGGLNYKKMAAWQGFMGALGAMGYMAGSAMLGTDENGKDRIAKVEPNVLTQKLLFPFGDKIAGVNLGLGLPQVLMAPGILGAAVAAGHIKEEDAVKAYMDTLARNGPISPAGNKDNTPTNFLASYLLGFTPTIARPVVDIERNTTVFNSSIHSEPSSGRYPSDSGRTNTPQVFKDMAQWLADTTDHKVDYAPEDIRYLIQNYGGQWASDIIKVAANSPDASAGAPESSRMTGRLFVNTDHYMQNEMYDTLDQLQDSRRRYSSIVSRAKDSGSSDQQAKAQADQIVSRDPKFKAELQAYRTLESTRKAYQQKINELRNNKLMSDTRKQLVRKQLDSQMRQAIEKAQAGIITD